MPAHPLQPVHSWNVTPEEAIALQHQLAPLVKRTGDVERIERIGGIDIGLRDGLARAAIVVLSYPGLAVLETVVHEEAIRFPYVPGLLSFREAPSILNAYKQLTLLPDLFIVDGQGIAHPRRLGIASHLGLFLNRPTIGSAKSILTGKHDPVGEEPGSFSPLIDKGEIIGVALRTKYNVKPLFISVGHLVSLERATEVIFSCARGYRLPEPQRQAHLAASGPTKSYHRKLPAETSSLVPRQKRAAKGQLSFFEDS